MHLAAELSAGFAELEPVSGQNFWISQTELNWRLRSWAVSWWHRADAARRAGALCNLVRVNEPVAASSLHAGLTAEPDFDTAHFQIAAE
jgi:hypothetical protein